MSTVALNDITIGYDDAGAGANTLVLVHGHPFDRSMWQPQRDSVSRHGWRVIVPDLRGYGETTVVPGKTTLDVFARDLERLLDHLGIDRVAIGGLSMGGQIVMEFCRLYPERVVGVLLAATFPRAETEAGKQTRYATADRLMGEGMASYAAELLPKMVAARTIETQPTVADHVMRMMRHAPPAGAAAALRGRAERPPYESTLAALAVPALIVVGDEDAFTTRADADQMHALVRGSELLWMEGIGHMPNLEQQDAFNAALARFLDGIASR
ncbi:MAG TPA: alpha/beta hydrolase [Vineibacter sp.]|nr:alpha/beta hydrolase [Vineibacter sp.]